MAKDPELVARTVLAALNGIVRSVLDENSPSRALLPARDELIVLMQAYLRACTAR